MNVSHYVPAAWVPYLESALQRAEYERLDDGTCFGHVPGFQGAWANVATQAACVLELGEVLYDWAVFRLEQGLAIPAVPGIEPPSLAAA